MAAASNMGPDHGPPSPRRARGRPVPTRRSKTHTKPPAVDAPPTCVRRSGADAERVWPQRDYAERMCHQWLLLGSNPQRQPDLFLLPQRWHLRHDIAPDRLWRLELHASIVHAVWLLLGSESGRAHLFVLLPHAISATVTFPCLPYNLQQQHAPDRLRRLELHASILHAVWLLLGSESGSAHLRVLQSMTSPDRERSRTYYLQEVSICGCRRTGARPATIWSMVARPIYHVLVAVSRGRIQRVHEQKHDSVPLQARTERLVFVRKFHIACRMIHAS